MRKPKYADEVLVERILASFRQVRPDKWVAATAADWQHVIRIESADENGNVQCVSCGRVVPYKQANGGHWIGRGRWATIFEPFNIHPQCVQCNRHDGDGTAKINYTLWMVDSYGLSLCEELLELAKAPRPSWTMEELAWRKLGYQKRIKEAEARLRGELASRTAT